MTIEQTTQLIQITFNALLLGLTSVLLLGGLMVRQMLLDKNPPDARCQALHKRHSLHNRRCLLWTSYTCGFALTSSLCIALRMVLNWNWLIPVSLTLFCVSIGLLLGTIALFTWSLHLGPQEPRKRRSKEREADQAVVLPTKWT
jgi:hypothetical protein